MKPEFMLKAIELAKTSQNDIPIGAVIVKNNEIISFGVNAREKEQNTVNHAEIIAIQIANKKLNNWRLNECEMYVTLEPWTMCASAIVQAILHSVYYGAYDMLNGAFISKTDMRKIMNIPLEVYGGIMEEECSKILKDYFKKLRCPNKNSR